MFGGGDGGYTLNARFQNAGQMVRGGLVEIGGQKVGTVTKLRLTDDGYAELELTIDEEFAPLPKGTHAQIRQFGLSGPASRYIDLRYPASGARRRRRRRDRDDDTTSNVDLDAVFSTFDRGTRDSLRKVFRGSNRQYAGEAENASQGMLYLDPALVSASRLFRELNRDTGELALRHRDLRPGRRHRRPPRRPRLAGLQPRRHDRRALAAARRGRRRRTGGRDPAAPRSCADQHDLREPPATLDDLDPLVTEFKPVARKLLPYTASSAGWCRISTRPYGTCPASPQARRPQRPDRPLARHAAAARHRRRPGAAQRRRARGRAAGDGRGACERHPAARLRPSLLERLHRLARRLLAHRQRGRARGVQPRGHPRVGLHVQGRADPPTPIARAAAEHRPCRAGPSKCPGAGERDTSATAPPRGSRIPSSTATRPRPRSGHDPLLSIAAVLVAAAVALAAG